jgi:hypothetical protein
VKHAPFGFSWPGFFVYAAIVVACLGAYVSVMFFMPGVLVVKEIRTFANPGMEIAPAIVVDIIAQAPGQSPDGRRWVPKPSIVKVQRTDTTAPARTLVYNADAASFLMGDRLDVFIPDSNTDFACRERSGCEPSPILLSVYVLWLLVSTVLTIRVSIWIKNNLPKRRQAPALMTL